MILGQLSGWAELARRQDSAGLGWPAGGARSAELGWPCARLCLAEQTARPGWAGLAKRQDKAGLGLDATFYSPLPLFTQS